MPLFMKNYIQNFVDKVKAKFRFGTLSFIFIIAYVNIFQLSLALKIPLWALSLPL